MQEPETKDWDQEPSTGGWWVYPFAVIDEFAGQNELEAAKCSLGLVIKITWQNRRLLGLIAAKGTWETPSWMTIWTSVSVKPFPSWSSFWSYFWETMRTARYPFRSLFAIHFWKVWQSVSAGSSISDTTSSGWPSIKLDCPTAEYASKISPVSLVWFPVKMLTSSCARPSATKSSMPPSIRRRAST